jgi:hypothetical protein
MHAVHHLLSQLRMHWLLQNSTLTLWVYYMTRCRCPHLAAACAEVLVANGHARQTFAVTTTHAAALALGTDLPYPADVLVADLVDDGVLSGGLLPAVAHALDANLLRPDAVLVPGALTVRMQAVALAASGCRAPSHSAPRLDGNGDNDTTGHNNDDGWIDLSALNAYRCGSMRRHSCICICCCTITGRKCCHLAPLRAFAAPMAVHFCPLHNGYVLASCHLDWYALQPHIF